MDTRCLRSPTVNQTYLLYQYIYMEEQGLYGALIYYLSHHTIAFVVGFIEFSMIK